MQKGATEQKSYLAQRGPLERRANSYSGRKGKEGDANSDPYPTRARRRSMASVQHGHGGGQQNPLY